MVKLLWGEAGQRRYETGLDRGVLYLTDGSGVPWNGLVSIEETGSDSSEPFFMDGVKYLDMPIISDYNATLTAFTYPEEFEVFDGTLALGGGLFAPGQVQPRFGLSYRTGIATDTDANKGHKIHIVYNLTAVPEGQVYNSLAQTGEIGDMVWEISGIPEAAPGYRPTAHVILDTTILNRFFVRDVEAILYGTGNTEPRLPRLDELVTFATTWDLITITDNGDGTWTAEGPDELITMTDATTFQITEVDATYSDANTYNVSTTYY